MSTIAKPVAAIETGPIPLSGPMVRATLDNRKTNTRRLPTRLLGFGPITDFGRAETPGYDWHFRDRQMRRHELRHDRLLAALPWRAGMLLWVRETWADEHPLAIQEGRYSQPGRAGIPGPPGVTYRTIYRADGEPLQIWRNASGEHPYFTLDGPADDRAAEYPTVFSNFTRDGRAIYWDSSVHMPRWASRLTLKVTAVKIERLQDISEADAVAEGCGLYVPGHGFVTQVDLAEGYSNYLSPRMGFETVWTSLHGPGSWDANPWVAAITFEPIRSNIDDVIREMKG